MKSEDMSRRALEAMDRLNKKHCQEELERINANIYPDTKFDCGNCPFADPKAAFLEELQIVLRKYNACIWVQGDPDKSLVISLNGDEYIVPKMYGVNADNIDIIKNKI